MRYTLGALARMRLLALLEVWLDLALPGQRTQQRYKTCMAASAASGDVLMSLILDHQRAARWGLLTSAEGETQ